ncbi:FUSC family protein [Commensalibacter oyaizuii]|uniref:FUSC family protein n=1 Tax=Commensalibacter oyaizuii TaxID=3043873 RepID=A0ABT6Q3L9_9PROT|nr:FUSC family protein [Commensalibacter sp. TBRC 16381]MDI2091731.1 FUSC family protein [Commensalibacter sp. TBRC 16381]
MHFIKLLSFRFTTLPSLRWIYAPPKATIIFVLRNLIASYIALTIALWMEMDSPRWAIMAVWVVAQNSSRGEILSKAYWVIFGNIIGMIAVLCIVASFPQQPLLFELSVAIWVSICCWFASCSRNFVSFGWSMAGFSCAIVLFATVRDQNETFMMVMSRGSYFILGILAENFTARLFDLNLQNNAYEKLNQELKIAIEKAIDSLVKILNGNNWAISGSDQVLSSVIAFNNTIEFRELEMRSIGRRGDHARATLSLISSLMVKAMGLSIHIQKNQKETLNFTYILPTTIHCLDEILKHLQAGKEITPCLQALNELRWECRQRIADSFYTDRNTVKQISSEYAQRALNDRILYQTLREVLAELEATLQQLDKSENQNLRDGFKFHMETSLDFKRAARNSIRAFVAITMGCLVWEITGWHNAPVFLSFLCMGCSRFCVFDNISLACRGWFKGICIAIITSAFFNFLVMPLITSIEMLCFILFFPLSIGALAMCVPKYAPIASGYMFFFCYLLGFSNQGRVDEVTFLNDSMALFMSGLVALFTYSIVFPYHTRRLRRQMRQKLLNGLHRLANSTTLPLGRKWIHFVSVSFVMLMRQLSEEQNSNLTNTYRRGCMAVMLIGINVIRLQAMVNNDIMTEDVKNILRVVLRRIAQFKGDKARYGQHARTVLIAYRAIAKFRKREETERNLAVRIEVSAAISSLILIAYALNRNASFLKVKSHNMLFY